VTKEKTEKRKFAVQLTPKSACIWGALVFFVMGWMFILGILVGRGTAPVPIDMHLLEKELAELKAAVLKKEQAKIVAQTAGGEVVATELGFYEKLKETPDKEPVRQPVAQAPVIRPKPTPTPVPAMPTPEPARPKPTSTPEKISPLPKARAEVSSAPAKTEESAPAASDGGDVGRYTVQVASFKALDGADEMVARLRTKGYAAYHVRVSVPDRGEWYRVRVGAFEGRSPAEAMLKKLRREQLKGMVVSTQ